MDLRITLDDKALELIRQEKPSAAILAMIQNSSAYQWDGAGLARMLADPEKRKDRIEGIAKFIEANNLQGVTIDFEQFPDTAHKDMLAFLTELSAAFKPHGWLVTVAAPFDDPSWNYKAYAKRCDYLMLMGYDEHWASGDAGPVWLAVLVLDPARAAHARSRSGSHHRRDRQLRIRLDRRRRDGGRHHLPGGDADRAGTRRPPSSSIPKRSTRAIPMAKAARRTGFGSWTR